VSVGCVLWCVGCLKGAVGWFVCLGAMCRFLSDFCLCLVICSGVGFVESSAFVACSLRFGLVFLLCGDSAGCEQVLFAHAVVLMDHLFADVPPFLGHLCGFRCGCAADMKKVSDGGLFALADAGVGPGLGHLEFRRESPDFQFNSKCFSLVVFTSPLPVRR